MLKAKLIYLKDKQAFTKEGGTLRLMGKPVESVKKLQEQGYGLVHIVDLDGLKGMRTNFDVYDKLTMFMHIEVEAGNNAELVEKLLGISARVVIGLPARIDLGTAKATGHKRLIVGKVDGKFTGNVDESFDLLVENADLESVKRLAKGGKRILVYSKDYGKAMEKYVFAAIEG